MAEQSAETPTIKCLTMLVERCKDGVRGFRTAAADVEDADLKHLFEEIATQRDHNITELQDYLHRTGHTASESTSIEADLHRVWINLKSAITSKDRARVLEECERGEDYAVAAYKKALEEELPTEAKGLVEKQYGVVKAAHDKVRGLRDAAKAA